MSTPAERATAFMAMSPAEQAADVRRRLEAMRRIVGNAIAHGMVSGDPARQATGWHLAGALDDQGIELEHPIRKALKALGADYDTVWVRPTGEATEPMVDLVRLRSSLARHIAGAYVSGSDDQVARARELESEVDLCGLNVDSKVDSVVLEQMRHLPSDRGTNGRADSCPF